MINSESLKQSEKLLIDMGLLCFKEKVEVPKSLSELLLKIITDWNVHYYTVKAGTIQNTDAPSTNRSTQDLFRIAKYYRPETGLEEMIDELWLLLYNGTLRSRYCGTIGCYTYYTSSNGHAYSNYFNDRDTRCDNKDGVLLYTINEMYTYFTLENLNARKEQREKAKVKTIKIKEEIMSKALKPKTGFRMRIRSRHPSHNVLRMGLPKLSFRSVLRLGSVTEVEDTIENGGVVVEINSIDGIKNSSSKRRMKECFMNAGVKTAEWYIINNQNKFVKKSEEGQNDKIVSKDELPFPIIAKSLFGSRGVGNLKLDTRGKLDTFLVGKNVSDYIFEKFYTYSREYRAHVTADGCFYTCRKMLKDGTPQEKKWQRHDDNCVWIREENNQFDKPVNWDRIINDCVSALEALGLDIAAFDIKVQGTVDSKGKKRQEPEYIIIESCSAPSFGDITAQKYIEVLPKLAAKLAHDYNII